jgi:GTP-dependent phosphoenolpyruvate carboxykinase
MLFFKPIDEIMDKTMLPNRQVEIEFKENEIALGYNDGSFIVSNNLTLYRMGIEGTQTLGSDRFIDASFSKSGKLGVLGESFYGENKAS